MAKNKQKGYFDGEASERVALVKLMMDKYCTTCEETCKADSGQEPPHQYTGDFSGSIRDIRKILASAEKEDQGEQKEGDHADDTIHEYGEDAFGS